LQIVTDQPLYVNKDPYGRLRILKLATSFPANIRFRYGWLRNGFAMKVGNQAKCKLSWPILIAPILRKQDND